MLEDSASGTTYHVHESITKLAEEEIKEKNVYAILRLTNEQPLIRVVKGLLDQYLHSQVVLIAKMDGTLSGTAEFSDEEVAELEQLRHAPKCDPTVAKLVLSQKQQSDLLEAFNYLDYTGEGKINADDFRVAIKALGYEPTKEELQKMVNAVDKGGTGRLSFENFQTAIMRKIMALDTDGDIMKSFRLFDIDDAGHISFDNLKKVTHILGVDLTDEEIEEMIDDADKNFDGYIDVQEFMKMIKNCVHIVTP